MILTVLSHLSQFQYSTEKTLCQEFFSVSEASVAGVAGMAGVASMASMAGVASMAGMNS